MTKEAIDKVRKYYKFEDSISDEQIARICSKSLGAATINLDIAMKRLIKAFRDCMPKLKFLNNEIKKIQPGNQHQQPDTVSGKAVK